MKLPLKTNHTIMDFLTEYINFNSMLRGYVKEICDKYSVKLSRFDGGTECSWTTIQNKDGKLLKIMFIYEGEELKNFMYVFTKNIDEAYRESATIDRLEEIIGEL